MPPETTPLPDVVARILEVLSHTPSALLSDFDGTLSPIAPTPEAAFLHPDLVHVLPVVAAKEPLFGIITGRAVEDARHKVGVDDVLLIGNHGLEWFDRGDYRAHPAGVAAEQAIVDALEGINEDLKALDRDLTGIVFENKRLSASIHYRLVPDPETFDAPLAAITQRRADEFGLRMTTGKMMVELRPTARVSKGSAVADIVTGRGLRGVVFLGDDVTDVDAFLAITQMRESGSLESGLSVGVLSEDTNPAIIASADVLVNDVNDVAAIIAELAQRLPDREDVKGREMSRRWRIRRSLKIAFVLMAVAMLGATSLVSAQSTEVPPWRVTPEAPLERVDIVVGDTPLTVELAQEDWQQQLGLGYRNGLEPGTGMLFPSDVARTRTFWMKGMRFCLDIIWINDGQITGAAEGACPDAAGTADRDRATFASPGPVTDVLEVPAGWLQEHGYGVGTIVSIPGQP